MIRELIGCLYILLQQTKHQKLKQFKLSKVVLVQWPYTTNIHIHSTHRTYASTGNRLVNIYNNVILFMIHLVCVAYIDFDIENKVGSRAEAWRMDARNENFQHTIIFRFDLNWDYADSYWNRNFNAKTKMLWLMAMVCEIVDKKHTPNKLPFTTLSYIPFGQTATNLCRKVKAVLHTYGFLFSLYILHSDRHTYPLNGIDCGRKISVFPFSQFTKSLFERRIIICVVCFVI